MSDLPELQHNRLTDWANKAIAGGWLTDEALQALDAAHNANPGQLFARTERPLVAGLFGGTGVGKSSLLNRLAGEEIARASAERPTSRDITLYVHHTVSVDRLPENFPTARIRSATHHNEQYRRVIFIDMPDIDSVEISNRELVDLWLPHLDVIMYVVSPERYRDDQGWQLLSRHVSEHAWLFVINQWDRGNDVQREDFTAQLRAQGLSDPMVFCTDCAALSHRPGHDVAHASDDFAALQRTLISLSDEQIVDHLHKHGVLARLQSLKALSETWLPPLGNEKRFTELTHQWRVHCDQQQDTLLQTLQWPIQQVAGDYRDTTPFWRRLLGRHQSTRSTSLSSSDDLVQSLNERMQAQLEQFINQQSFELALPLKAIAPPIRASAESVLSGISQHVNDALAHSLLNPGSQWHRRLYRFSGLLCLILPLGSLAWISFRVVGAFAQGGSDTAAYLGSSFAINSALLLGVSWLLPALAHASLRPSPERAARDGMEQGIHRSVEALNVEVGSSLSSLSAQSSSLASQYQQLWSELPSGSDTPLPESVRHMLSTDTHQTVLRELDVRANTHNSTDAAPLS